MPAQRMFSSLRLTMMPHCLAAVALMLIGTLVQGQEVADDGGLESAVSKLAIEIDGFLSQQSGEKDLAIGAITGPPQLASSSGLSLKKMLMEKLTERGVNSTRRAELSCKGEYFFDENDPTVLLTVSIDRGPRTLVKFEHKVHNAEDMATVLGLSGKLSADPVERPKDVIKNVQAIVSKSAEPTVTLAADKTQLITQGGGDYAVEIWVKEGPQYIRRELIDDDGLTFCNLDLENIYAVRVINRSKHRAAVTLSIDGLNLFTFSQVPEYRELGKIIIPPHPEGFLIKGWHISNQIADSFMVSEYGESAKASLSAGGDQPLQPDEQVGTITASFAIAVPTDYVFGEGEAELLGISRSLASKRGPSVEQNFFPSVPVKMGRPVEVLSIRYSRPLPP